MPEVWYINDGNYINFVYATGSRLRFQCARAGAKYLEQTGLQRLTYSVTLDQIAAWGGSPVNDDPAIIFFSDASSMGAGPYVLLFRQLRVD